MQLIFVFCLSFTNVRYGRVYRSQDTRDATDVAAWEIIACFIDILDIVQLPASTIIIG